MATRFDPYNTRFTPPDDPMRETFTPPLIGAVAPVNKGAPAWAMPSPADVAKMTGIKPKKPKAAGAGARVAPVEMGVLTQASREPGVPGAPGGLGAVAPNFFSVPNGGYIRNEATGATYNFRGALPAATSAPTAAPQATTAPGLFAQGALGLKQIAGDNARKAAATKAAADLATKAPGAQKDAFSVSLAQQHLAANPGDLEGAAAILSGKTNTSTVSVPQGYMGDYTKDVPVVTTRGPGAGTIKLTTPQRGSVTEANITASMQAKGLTREQAKQAYRTEGYDVSQIK